MPLPADPVAPVGPFEELDVTLDGDVVQFRLARESSYGQMVALGVSTFLFMLFFVSVMPLMRLTPAATALWVVVALLVLVGVGVVTQARLRTATLRLTPVGVEVEQGTAVDQEHASIPWADVLTAELEPVDPKDGRRGMQLRLVPREGEPVDVFGGLDLGDLGRVRRSVLAMRTERAGRS